MIRRIPLLLAAAALTTLAACGELTTEPAARRLRPSLDTDGAPCDSTQTPPDTTTAGCRGVIPPWY